MGQKVHPHGFRVGIIKDWDSRWYARADKVSDLIIEDYKIREHLKKLLNPAGIPRIEIERDNTRVRILIHCARPGLIIGRGGAEIEKLRADMEKRIGKPVAISIIEVKNADTDAQLVAEGIAQRLEKRVGYRRAMKNAMGRAMRLGIRGIKVMVAGRLGGAEIAKSETYHEGTIPLQTIRADIDYGFAEAATTYGRIGVKVWIYKGEILTNTLRTTPRTMDLNRQQRDRRDNRNRNNNRSGGANRSQGSGGYQGNRDNNRTQSSGGYQGNRDNNRTQGSGGYQGNRDNNRTQSSGGYQGNRDSSRTGGNQGNRQPSAPRSDSASAPKSDGASAPKNENAGAPKNEGGEG